MVSRLELFGRLGQEVGAPIGYATDHAALLEDDLAGGFGDSVKARY